LVWNRRDEDQPLWAEISRIIEPLRAGAPQHSDGRWRASFAEQDIFAPVDAATFAYRQTVTRSGVVDRIGSISFIAALAPDEHVAITDRIAATVADEPEPVALDYLTEAFVFARVGR
jgi:hypothetical protein